MAAALEVFSESGHHSGHGYWDMPFYNQLRRRAAYLRMSGGLAERFAYDGKHYLAAATLIMKHSLIDRARASRSVKRFGCLKRTPLTADIPLPYDDPGKSYWVNDLFEKCARFDVRRAAVARMHFLEEMTLDEIAAVLCLSTRTVKRDLRAATIQLREEFNASTRSSHLVQ
jgi:RNA polymerase sigma factor (sigma-70 family)